MHAQDNTRTSPHWFTGGRGIVLTLVINLVVCSLIAVFLWSSLPGLYQQSLGVTWIYSQTIGQTLCVLFLLWSAYGKSNTRFRGWQRLGVFVVIVVVGYAVGLTLGNLINGHPIAVFRQGNFFTVSFAIALVVSLLSNAFYYSQDKLALLKLKASEEQQRATDAKLSMLKAQVEPHMLFNTLANLRVLIDKDPQAAKTTLDHLIDFLRSTLDGSRATVTTVEREFQIIDHYLALMKIRFGQYLNYELHVDASVRQVELPALLIQPLVENAIKYGIEPSVDNGEVRVSAISDQDGLLLSITNSGARMAINENAEGFGLHSVRERLHAQYGEAHQLTIQSPVADSEGGTHIEIRIPLHA